MSKNKLIWNIALFLVIIISLPIAHAQTFTGSSWFFILVNSLIVGVVLFILQTFLIPKKDPKEQTAVWVAIIIGSLLIGFLFGRNGFIWATGPFSKFFNIYVLVNALIIGIVAYFALGLLKVADIQSPQGKTSYGILIFIGALVWAIGIANSYGNVFVWQAYRYFISYFIGPEGILNPYPPQYRLLVFAGSAVLLAFFFSNYLITGAGANKTVNYALALILAMNMASSGVSVRSVIILGEIIFVLVLQKALVGGPAQNKWVSWLFAIGLVGWASAAMTYGTEYQGAIATPIGWIMSWFGLVQAGTAAQPTSIGWWAKILFVVVGVMLLFGGGLFVIGRSEAGRRLLGNFVKRNFTRLRNELKTIFQKHATQIGVVTRWDVPEGREPKSFVENRLLLFALLDYCLRLDIFNSKRYIMDYKKKAKINALWGALDRHWNRKTLREEIADYRSATPVTRRARGTAVTTFAPYGWALFDKMLLENMEGIVRLMYDAVRLVNNADPNLNRELTDRAQTLENINNKLRTIAESAETAYGNFDSRFEPYGIWHHIRSIILNAYDMYNVYGKFEHDYIFPTEGAKFRANSYLAPDPTNMAAINALPDANPLIDPLHEHSASDIELNTFGFELERINNNRPPLRLLNSKKHSHFHPNLPYLMSLYSTEWKGMVEDFRKGTYSPNSRTVQDYSDSFAQGKDVHMDDDSVAFKRQGGIAFDRKALVDPGLWKYWGRRHYHGDLNDVVMESPYPRLTALGIQTYLELLIRRRERDPEKVINDFLNSYPLDLEKEIETDKDIVRAIGRWREKKAS